MLQMPSLLQNLPGPKNCGSTTTAPMSIKPSNRNVSHSGTLKSSLSCTVREIEASAGRHERKALTPALSRVERAGRWRSFDYEELIARDKTNLDIFWLKDDSLEDTENPPPPEVLAQEIVEQLEVALEEFRSVEELLDVTRE